MPETQLDQPTKTIADFFLELSSPVRIQILNILSQDVEFRNSAIAKKLNISAQESLRHMSRLVQFNLVTLVERQYRIAPIGTLVLESLLPQVNFLLKNEEFFDNHDVSVLPPLFTKRFSEIADDTTEIIEGPSEIIAMAENIIENANKFCYDTAKLITRSTNQLMAQKKSGVKIKQIKEKNSKKPRNIPEVVSSDTRVIEHLDLAIVVSEQQAYIRFPKKTGEISLEQALYSTSRSFVIFAKDLFNYYWEQSYDPLSTN